MMKLTVQSVAACVVDDVRGGKRRDQSSAAGDEVHLADLDLVHEMPGKNQKIVGVSTSFLFWNDRNPSTHRVFKLWRRCQQELRAS